MLDLGPVYARVVERLRWLPEQDDATPTEAGDLPPREQRLLLMRLASLFGPDAIAQAPRAERFRTEAQVRVVIGLPALTRAIAEIERMPAEARAAGLGTVVRRSHADREPDGEPGERRAAHPGYAVDDDRPQRHRLPPVRARAARRRRGWAS